MTSQIPLDLGRREAATFEAFVAGPNEALVDALRAVALGRVAETGIFLWGGPGLGKTHLLQAVCAAAVGGRAAYVPLADRGRFVPAVLEGLEQLDVVCLDDAHCVAGDREWELALVDLYHRLQDTGARWAVAGAARAQGMGLLPDLASRLAGGLTFGLQELDEAEKRQVLQCRAATRGLTLADDAAHYLLTHCPRDLKVLCGILDRLDTAALAAQRRLTLPFIRSVLSG
ncbi:MAG: DnaA regulatory inactivator Hda [Gammaproteobacteria bacterium]|nr:DnaA regulatory inactivator Hda [Gammaproteobacteria bacterium]